MKMRQKKFHFQNINQQMTLVSISTFAIDILVAGKIEFMKVISLEIANSTTYIYDSNHKMPYNVTKEVFMKSYIAMILISLFTCNIRCESVMKEALLSCIQN
jgi:hypothetical protein